MVEIAKIIRVFDQEEQTFINTVYFTVLDTEDGHPTAEECWAEKSYSSKRGDPLEETPPDFVAAIDRWATVPDARPAYADVLDVFEHGFGLLNAKYLARPQAGNVPFECHHDEAHSGDGPKSSKAWSGALASTK